MLVIAPGAVVAAPRKRRSELGALEGARLDNSGGTRRIGAVRDVRREISGAADVTGGVSTQRRPDD